jgi:murein DD-endopeptidase MepM/ murein hydrolase activator NlpD
LRATLRIRGTQILLGLTYLFVLLALPLLLPEKRRVPVPVEEVLQVAPEPVENVLVDTLKSGDTLETTFKRRGFRAADLFEIVQASRSLCNLNRLHTGAVLTLVLDEAGEIADFRCTIDESKVLVVDMRGGACKASLEQIPFTYETRSVQGVIESSLYETFEDLGEDPILCIALSDVFAWQVDFHTDLRGGDVFSALVEEKHYDGKPPVFSRVLAARLMNQGKALTAVKYEDPEGHVDYYDILGKSLKRKFLRSPLKYTKISSGYSKRRYHPILKIYRPHLGIDYAAPTGTPVVSVGDGVVAYAGWSGGFGRYVKVRHNSTYETTYGHLSRYGRGIRTGARVAQGQVVGYVGSSGLATGPHLDYRLLKNGYSTNPLTVDLPTADPVKEAFMDEFTREAVRLLGELEGRSDSLVLSREENEGKNGGS